MTQPLNEDVLPVGNVADIGASSTFDVAVTVRRASIVKGVVVNSVPAIDAINTFEIEINGAVTSPVTLCLGSAAAGANTGEFVGAGRRLEVNPGDRIEVTCDGANTNTGLAYASVVLGR